MRNTALVQGPGVGVGVGVGDSVSLAELTSRTHLEWYESLAIILELCGTIFESDDQVGPSTIAPETVFVASTGDVFAIAGPQAPHDVVRRIGQIFARLLPDVHRTSTFGPELSQALSVPPGYSSLDAMSRALAPYERPERRAIIQEAYLRCYERKTAPPGYPQDIPFAASSRSQSAHRRTTMAVRAAAVVVTAVSATALVVWAIGHARRGPVQSAEAPALDPVQRAVGRVVQTLESVIDRMGSSVGIAMTAGSTDSLGRSSDAMRPISQSISQTRSGRPDRPAASRVTASSSRELPASNSESISNGSEAWPEAPSLLGSDRGADLRDAPAPIFSAQDDGVTPPEALFLPRVLWRMPASPRPEDQTTIEIVINENGLVESARARQRMNDLGRSIMLTESLSAAKSWRFRPALKDGRPVRYRQLVPVMLEAEGYESRSSR